MSAVEDLTTLKGAGPRVADKLSRLGIHNLEDLLFHFPSNYQDRTRIISIHALRPGMDAMVQGAIEISSITYAGKRSLVVRISDSTGFLDLRFFYFSAAQKARLEKGAILRCYGQVRRGRLGLEMVHPEYQIVDDKAALINDNSLTPIYPSTEGLHQGLWRRLLKQAIEHLEASTHTLEDVLPEDVKLRFNYPSLKQAICQIHRPDLDTDVSSLLAGEHPALERLAFEELLAHHLALRIKKQSLQSVASPIIHRDAAAENQLLSSLPFALTSGQHQALEDIFSDLASGQAMRRLLQGDVGCGKTVVAALASFQVAASGLQVAVMAPTEILAEQLLVSFRQILPQMASSIRLLTGSIKGKPRTEILLGIKTGDIRIIIGTHALFQNEVEFSDLGLVVIDEQHRFGVHQRMALRNKGVKGASIPHQLIMTATPIPRTLTMTFYADLDCSVINSMPAGRKPVETVVMPESRRDDLIERIEGLVSSGQQVYWVCPLIEESEVLQCQAAEETYQLLSEQLPNLRIELIHGRVSYQEKDRIMSVFRNNECQLLVATTVIEVGVNIPNATLMVIENAERMGLSQLHQLRGRVGRGVRDSACVLLYRSPLSFRARERLAVMRESNDGFRIAEKDLELRGPGDLLGTRQTGDMQFKVADLQKHQRLLNRVQQTGTYLLEKQPDCIPLLIRRWCANAMQYSQV